MSANDSHECKGIGSPNIYDSVSTLSRSGNDLALSDIHNGPSNQNLASGIVFHDCVGIYSCKKL